MTRPRSFAAFLISSLALLAFAPAAEAATVTSADIELRFADDGALLVTETIFADFATPEGTLSKTIPLADGVTIRKLDIREQTTDFAPAAAAGKVNTFTNQLAGKEAKIDWFFAPSSGIRVFTLTYEMPGAVQVYDDATELDIELWSADHDFLLESLTARVIDPALGEESRVWISPREQLAEITETPGAIGIETTDVPAGEGVELHLIAPANLLQGTEAATVNEGPGLETALEREAEADSEYNSPLSRAERAAADNEMLILVALVALALISLALLAYIAEGRPALRRISDQMPSGTSPAEALALVEGHVDFPRALAATFFDLTRRGVWMLSKDAEGRLEVRSLGAIPDNLPPHEQELAYFFRPLIGRDPVVVEDVFASLAGAGEEWQRSLSSLEERFDSLTEEHVETEQDLNRWRYLITAFFALAALAVGLLAYKGLRQLEPQALILAALVAGVIVVSSLNMGRERFLKISPRSAERREACRAYARWLKNADGLAKHADAGTDWDQISIWALALDVGERLEGRVPSERAGDFPVEEVCVFDAESWAAKLDAALSPRA